MVTQASQLFGDMHESHAICRAAGEAVGCERGKIEERHSMLAALALLERTGLNVNDLHQTLGFKAAIKAMREVINKRLE